MSWELLLQEQKLEIQNEAQVELQEDLADIEGAEQTSTSQSATTTTSDSKKKTAHKVQIRKGSGSSGSGKRGRPKMSSAQWDENRNKINPVTGRAYSKWDEYNATH